MALPGELSAKALAVGQRVLCSSWTATVRFVGATEFAAGDWVGLELDRPGGKHDGTVQGVRYFECPPGRGVFCRAHTLKPLLEPTPEGEAREDREEDKAQAAEEGQGAAGAVGGPGRGSCPAAEASSVEARTRLPSSASTGSSSTGSSSSSSSSSASASASSASRHGARKAPIELSSGMRELSQDLEAAEAQRDSGSGGARLPSKASGCGEEEVDLGSREQLIRKLFEVADGNKNGFLDREEFLRLVLALSDALSPEDIDDIFDTLMSDNGLDPAQGVDVEALDVLLSSEDGFHASEGLLCNALATLREGLAGFSTPTRRQPRLLEAYASPDVAKIGLVFESVPPNRAIVKEVIPDSWADHMGFEPGDELVAVGGRAVGAMTADIFRHALRQRPLGLNMFSQSPNGREVRASPELIAPAPAVPPPPSFSVPASGAPASSSSAPLAAPDPGVEAAQASSRIAELEARERVLQAQVQELQARLEAERVLQCGASGARPGAPDLATNTASASTAPASLQTPLRRALSCSACSDGSGGLGVGGLGLCSGAAGSKASAHESAGAMLQPYRHGVPGRLITTASVERQYQRAYKSREETLGACHPDTLAALASLGAKLQSLRMVQRSEEVRLELTGRLEKDCGPCWLRRQPAGALAWLLRAVNNFAVLLKVGGRPIAAETLQRWELAAGEIHLGPEHPDTLTSAANMGLLLDELGKPEEAAALHRRAWQGREAAFGPDHAATRRSRLALASALERCGRLREAEDLRSRSACVGSVDVGGGGGALARDASADAAAAEPPC